MWTKTVECLTENVNKNSLKWGSEQKKIGPPAVPKNGTLSLLVCLRKIRICNTPQTFGKIFEIFLAIRQARRVARMEEKKNEFYKLLEA